MLILIVVAAAIALAAFVASYQKQLQAEEAQSQQRSLESLKILTVTPTLNTSNTKQVSSLAFVLASEYINPSQIDSISLNGYPLKDYWALNLSNPSGTPTIFSSSVPLLLAPRQEVIISVNLSDSASTWFSLYDTSFVLTTSDYIQLSVYTALQNTFTQVFIPPTAIAFVTTLTSYTSSGPIQIPILDGTGSFQPGANSTIVEWEWAVSNVTVPVSPSFLGDFYGAEWELPGTASMSISDFNATLIVTSSDGLESQTNVSFSSYIGSPFSF